MKKLFFSTLFFLFMNVQSGFSQTGDTTLVFLSNLNLSLYRYKPIDSFLTKIPGGILEMRIASPGNPKYAEVLSIRYPDNVYLGIYVYNFQFMNPRSESRTWDMTLFKKENIHHIEVWKREYCYNGCPYGVLIGSTVEAKQ